MTSKGVALVTGSSQGIGKAIALRLADDGYDLAINDVSRGKENLIILSKEIEAKGRKVFIFEGDVSIERDVVAMVEGAVEHLGGLDVVSSVSMIVVLFLLHRIHRWWPMQGSYSLGKWWKVRYVLLTVTLFELIVSSAC